MNSPKTSTVSDYGSMQDSLDEYSREELMSMYASEREQRLKMEKALRKQRKFTEQLNEEIKQRSELASDDRGKIKSLEKKLAQKEFELKQMEDELQKLKDATHLDSKIKGGISHLVVIEGELERCKRLNSELAVELNSHQTLVEKLQRKLSERTDSERKHTERERKKTSRYILDTSVKKHRKHRHGHHRITLSESYGKMRDHTGSGSSLSESRPNLTELSSTSSAVGRPSSTDTLKDSEQNPE